MSGNTTQVISEASPTAERSQTDTESSALNIEATLPMVL